MSDSSHDLYRLRAKLARLPDWIIDIDVSWGSVMKMEIYQEPPNVSYLSSTELRRIVPSHLVQAYYYPDRFPDIKMEYLGA